MRPRFEISANNPLIIDNINGIIKMWDANNKVHMISSKEFWMDVTTLIKSTRKHPHVVRITSNNIETIDKKYL
jgi:hypothetical protein